MLPRNGIDLIRRVMARFGLDGGQYLTIIPNSGTHTHLPIDEPAPLLGVLGSCVELQDVATRDDIATLARYTDDPAQKAALEALAGDDEAAQQRYRDEVFTPNRSVLDLLEAFPACALPFAEYLDMLPPLRPRYYSISSSPLVEPGRLQHHRRACCTARPAPGTARSPASAPDTWPRCRSDGTVFTFVRSPSIAFRPPENPHTPMIMIGAGTGLAPFRGFLQERAALRDQGVPVGPSLLFFGCRNREVDLLYADELRDYQAPRPRAGGERVLPRHRHPLPLRAGRHARLRRRGLGAAAARGRRVRLRQRLHHRARRPQRPHHDLPRQDRHRGGRRPGLALGLRTTDRFVEDIWGG